jgi:hypothetical protein
LTDPTEHPRPLLRRPWTSLSGEWDFAADPDRRLRWATSSSTGGSRCRSGATVDLCASAGVDGEEVWRGRSTYLARGAKAPEGAPESDVSVAIGEVRQAATWRVPDDAGR